MRSRFFGEIAAQRNIPLGQIVVARHLAGSRLAPHAHRAAYVSICLSGSYREMCAGTEETILQGERLLHPSAEKHGDVFECGEVCVLSFSPSPAAFALYGMDGYLAERKMSRAGMHFFLAAERWLDHQSDRITPVAFQVADSILTQIAHDVNYARATDWRIAHVLALIERGFARRLALHELAKAVTLHPVSLAQKFHSELGSTIGQFLRRARLQHATRMILVNGTTITEAAHASGFADAAHLSNTFRKWVGQSPSAFCAGFEA